MAPTGIDVWRPLMQKLRSIARKPAGTVKPTCSGGRAGSQDLSADFTWEGEAEGLQCALVCARCCHV